MVKNPPAMQETWIQSWDQKDLLEKEWQPTAVSLPGKSHAKRGLPGCRPLGCKKVRHNSEETVTTNIEKLFKVIKVTANKIKKEGKRYKPYSKNNLARYLNVSRCFFLSSDI